MTVNKRIKERRKELGLTVDEVAKALGKNRATVYRYESEEIKKLPVSVLEDLAKVLRTTPAELLAPDGPIQPQPITMTRKPPVPGSIPYDPSSGISIPIVGKVAAGYSCLAETNIVGYELASPELIQDSEDYIWLEVQGDSMEPYLLEGDLALVRLQPIVDDGDLGVVIIDEEDGLIKRIRLEPDKVTLVSINPYYPPREFEREEMNRVRIIGKVIELKRKL